MSDFETERRRSRTNSPSSAPLLDLLGVKPFLGNEIQFGSAISKMNVQVAKTPKLCCTAYRLFPVLASMMNRRTGYCYPGVHRLAAELGVSPQVIRKACRELEKASLLYVDRNSSCYNTNTYYLDMRTLEWSWSCTKDKGDASQKPAIGVSPRLIEEIFGETHVAHLSCDDIDVLLLAEERSRHNA